MPSSFEPLAGQIRARLPASEPPEVLLGLQDRFDTNFLDSPAWQRARSAA